MQAEILHMSFQKQLSCHATCMEADLEDWGLSGCLGSSISGRCLQDSLDGLDCILSAYAGRSSAFQSTSWIGISTLVGK